MEQTEASEQDPTRKRGNRATAASGHGEAYDADTIGAALRNAREAAGLTLQDVADRTKVRPGLLAQIEADDHEKLPALTYALGFVKAYARTVGIDPEEAAARYRRESHKGDPVPTMHDLQPLEEQRLPSRRLAWLSAVLVLLALLGFWAWGAGWLTPVNPPRPETPANAPAAVPAEPSAQPAPGAPPPADPNAQVTLTAKEEVWVRISEGKENFFMGTMKPAQTLTLPPGRTWVLRTGRAGALEVKLGNRVLPPLGGPAETVRSLSLKPEDLLAKSASAAGGLATPPGGGLATPPAGGLATPPAGGLAAPHAAPAAPAG